MSSPDLFRPYVPAIVLRQLATKPDYLAKPEASRQPAAVLFADVSGFTPLAERLASRGPDGAEELNHILNDYFGQLIATLTAHGGDVIKFAGDAVIVVWPVEVKEATLEETQIAVSLQATAAALRTVTLRAAQCALEIQRLLHDYRTPEGTHLGLRVSVGAGIAITASLGGERGRWEFLLAGEAITQATEHEQHTRVGEVTLSPEAWALCAAACTGTPVPHAPGTVRLTHVHQPIPPRPLAAPIFTPELASALRGYLPGAVLSHLTAGVRDLEALAEVRRVTVLFVDIGAVDYTAPNLINRLQTILQTLQNILYQYEGSVNQFLVDDKGTILLTAFGLPPLTHEDDAVRALQAAQAMHSALQALQQTCAMGVASGRVFCGTRGNSQRREYALIGDVVNLAARLMGAARKYSRAADLVIVCDEATAQAAAPNFPCGPLPPIQLKGKAEPVPIYAPLRATPQLRQVVRRPSLPLVGRAAEQALIIEKLQALTTTQQGGVLVVEGEAGVGKSRLVADLRERATGLGVSVRAGAATALEQTTPYFAWRAVLMEVLGLGLFDAETARQHIDELLAATPDLQPYAPSLSVLLPLEWPIPSTDLSLGARADVLRALLLALLQAAAQHVPQVLILDDAQWGDAASWALAADVARLPLPILLVVALRPLLTPPPDYAELLATPGATHLRLAPLPPAEVTALVCHCLHVKQLPERVTTFIHAKAQGNPFFSEQLALALREAGVVQITAEEAHLAADRDLNTVSLPTTIEGLITSRTDQLPPAQELLLKNASVFGQTFATAALQALYPLESEQARVAEHLRALHQLDLLSPNADGETWAFKHALTQEVIYNRLPLTHRRALHRRIAEWYAQTYADAGPHAATRAYHWQRAIDPRQPDPVLYRRALEALAQAGENASTTYSADAVRFLQTALELAAAAPAPARPNAPTRAHWARLLGETYSNLGRNAEAREQLEQTLQHLGLKFPATFTALSGATGWEALQQLIHRARGRAVVEPAPTTSLQFDDLGRAAIYLVQGYVFSNQVPRAFWLTLWLINQLEKRQADRLDLVQAYAALAFMLAFAGWPQLGQRYERLAQAQLPTLPPFYQATVVGTLSYPYIARGAWARAIPLLEKSIELFTRIGERRQRVIQLNNRAFVAYFQGDYARMTQLYTQIGVVAREGNDAEAQVWELQGTALAHWKNGALDAALALLQAAAPHYAQLPEAQLSHLFWYGLQMNVQAARGDWAAATQAATMAEKMLAAAPTQIYINRDVYVGLVEVALHAWAAAPRDAAARAAAHRACRAFSHFARFMPVGKPGAAYAWGRYYAQLGQPARARAHWQKSLQLAQTLHLAPEVAQAQKALGL